MRASWPEARRPRYAQDQQNFVLNRGRSKREETQPAVLDYRARRFPNARGATPRRIT